MPDLTYNRKEIEKDPVWELAFTLSEIENDNAPIGWCQYIATAKCLLAKYDISRKTKKETDHAS